MRDPNFIILYVASPEASASFYSKLLDKEPIEASSTFAMFQLDSGMRLGLWMRTGVEPAATVTGGGVELVFVVESEAAVRACHHSWEVQGLPILQQPVAMDFGFTFVAQDPDGHRLRVYRRTM